MHKTIILLTKLIGWAAAVALLCGVALAPAASAAPEDQELRAIVNGRDPSNLTLTLTNVSSHSCQIVALALGTVGITSVRQSGRTITPKGMDVEFAEGLKTIMATKLQTLTPGQSATIPLLTTGQALEPVTWAPGAGPFAMRYQLQPHQAVQIELTYSVPVPITSGVPACGAVAATTAAPITPWWQWLLIAVASVAGVCILGVVVWWLTRGKRSRGVAAVLLLLAAGLATMLWQPPAAHATITVDPAAQHQFDACMAMFHRHQDITGEALRALDEPSHDVRIVYQVGPTEALVVDNQYVVRWDPNDRLLLSEGEGTRGVPNDPCTALYHELYHHFDRLYGAHSYAPCADSGLRTTEVYATRAENQLRAAEGLPVRTMYDAYPLPTGECAVSPPARCGDGSRCGGMYGEPHLTTFDGLRYDFQGAGEFVAARDSTGSYEIQVRDEPYLTSRQVATNTAIAMRVAGDRVELDLYQGGLKLLVNGTAQLLQATKLPGGGTLTATDDREAIVAWPDGSTATITVLGVGLYTSFVPSADKVGKLEGLLGGADGNDKNDLKLRGSGQAVHPVFKELYPAFADSWRVNDATSLFTYKQGMSTASYTDHSFPSRPTNLAELPTRGAAEELCRSAGVSDETALANCTLDAALTGRPDSISAAVIQQTLQSDASRPDLTWHLVTQQPGDSASATFQGKAGARVFVDVQQSTLPDQCGVLRLFSPENNEIGLGCLSGGKGFIDSTVLPTTGTYTIKITPSDQKTGQTSLRAIFSAEQKAPIVVGGPAVVVKLDRPGALATLSFSGQAGQRVYAELTGSTIPDQCGALFLRAPNGDILSNPCIVRGASENNQDPIALPVSGQYTLTIDPAGWDTGQITARVHG